MRKLLVLTLLIAIGCSTQTAQRTTAERLAGQVTRMQTDLGALAESRTNIAVARHHIAEELLRSALETELVNADRLQSMPASQKQMFDKALAAANAAKTRRAKSDDELAAAEAVAKAETSRIDTHAEELGAAAKLLGRLAEKQNWPGQLNFYFHFFNEVKESLDEMNASAQKDQSEAESQTAAQAEGAETEKAKEKEKP